MGRSIGLVVAEPTRDCSDENCPFHGSRSVQGQTLVGTVDSTDMQKTVIVEREYDVLVPKYDRLMKRRSRIPAHHPPCLELQVGDEVKICETRPISKTKSHVVVEKIQDNERETITVQKEEGFTQITVSGRDMYSLVEYDGFYGLYWDSDISWGEWLAQLISLGDSLHSLSSDDQKSMPPVLDGVIVQDLSKEVNISQRENEEIFDVGEMWGDFPDSELNHQISDVVSEVDPDLPITFLRINTPYFNCSWEDSNGINKIGLLTHHRVNNQMTDFIVNTSKNDPFNRNNIKNELQDELESQTGEYK